MLQLLILVQELLSYDNLSRLSFKFLRKNALLQSETPVELKRFKHKFLRGLMKL